MAEAGPELLGVLDAQATAPYRSRAVDDAIEDALGTDRPLVAVTGDRLAGSSRALHRALRRMLGDRLLLPVADPHAVDLAAAVRVARETAARSGPVVIAADDAPPALLDQVDDALLGALGGDVRLVLTTRRTFLGAYLAAPTRARIEDATIAMPPGPIGGALRPVVQARAVLDPVGWTSRVPLALLRTAADWERLGVPLPLTPDRLAEVAPLSLAALGAPPAERGELRRAVRDLLRADHGGLRLLHTVPPARSTRIAADRLFSFLADGDADAGGWAVPEDLARDLWHRLAPEERARVARVALARGDGQAALWLATQVPPDDFEPEALYRLGVALAERSAAYTPEPGRWDGGALRWLAAALDRADADLVPRARRAILAVEARREEPAARLPTARLPTVRLPTVRPPTVRPPADGTGPAREITRV